MIDSFIDIIGSWIPIWNTYLVDYFALSFIAFTGCFIHRLIRR